MAPSGYRTPSLTPAGVGGAGRRRSSGGSLHGGAEGDGWGLRRRGAPRQRAAGAGGCNLEDDDHGGGGGTGRGRALGRASAAVGTPTLQPLQPGGPVGTPSPLAGRVLPLDAFAETSEQVWSRPLLRRCRAHAAAVQLCMASMYAVSHGCIEVGHAQHPCPGLRQHPGIL